MASQCQTFECCLKSPSSWRKTCGMCEPPRICDNDRDCRTGLKCTNGNCLPVITPKTTPPTRPPVKKCSRFQDCRSNECCLIGRSGGRCGRCTNPPCGSASECRTGEFCVKGPDGNFCSGTCPDTGPSVPGTNGMFNGVFDGVFDGMFDGAFDDVHKPKPWIMSFHGLTKDEHG